MLRTPHLTVRRLAPAITALALGGSLLALSGCSSPASAAPPRGEPARVHVDAVVVEARSVPRTVALTGTLVAARTADVAADASGRVLAVLADRGDAVVAGAPLARLDARSAALASAEAGASAAALSAQEANAELECRRADQLLAGEAISRAEYDRIHASCATSSHSVDAARARQRLAQKALGDAVVRAPFSGVVAERRVEAGDYVGAGRSVVTLVDTSTLKLELSVPETAITNVREGRLVTFSVIAYPGRVFAGRVSRQAPVLRPNSRDEIVEVAVENADGALRPGMFAEAKLAIGEDRLPVVPAAALSGQPPSERLFVIGRDGHLEERVVATGERVAGGIAVTRGLAAGERVVASASPALKDGAPVD